MAEQLYSALIMRSVRDGDVEEAPLDDRTARARIRDAAIARFAETGVAGTSIRTIAGAAGVSPGLVIHHFGSKDGLRVACDQHVAALVRDQKRTAMAEGVALDPLAALRRAGDGPPLLHYLARTLVDGSPHVAELVDGMVEDAVEYMEDGVASGLLKPSADRRAQVALLTIWSLGGLVMHEHYARLTGVDLTNVHADPEGAAEYFRAAVEVLGDGIFTPETIASVRARFGDVAVDTSETHQEEEAS